MANRDLTFYKSKIDLFQFMLDSGFEQTKKDKQKSTNKYKICRNPSTDEKYIVKKNNQGFYTYFSFNDINIKGSSIIDFVQNFYDKSNFSDNNITIGHVKGFLDKYLNGSLTKEKPVLAPIDNQYNIGDKSPLKHFVSYDTLESVYGLKPLFDTSFLTKQRNISPDTINNEVFKNTVHNTVYTDNKKRTYINTAFLFLNENNDISGLSVRNSDDSGNNLKRTFLGKDGLVPSNNLNIKNNFSNSPIFYFSESYIDCLSHYEINKKEFANKNIRYFSTEGTPSDKQFNLINSLNEYFKPEKNILIFDNDISGLQNSTKFLCNLNSTNSNNLIFPENTLFQTSVFYDKDKHENKIPQAYFGQIDISFTSSSKTQSKSIFSNFHDYFSDFNLNKVMPSSGEKNCFELSFNNIGKLSNISILFPNLKNNWQHAFDFANKLKFDKSKQILQDKPLLNDFNEDLSLYKNKHHKYKVQNINNNLVVTNKHSLSNSKNFTISNNNNISP